MSKDVAQRELDQAGFKISNLGDPTVAGDATKTDNATVPRAASGTGSAGTSLLAAPADHVHPAAASSSSYSATFSDPSEQSQSGPAETVIAQFPVDFTPSTPNLIPTFAAIVDVDSGTATFNVRLSTTPDVVDGGILATITKTAEGGPQLLSNVGASFVPLTVPALIKITAANDNAAVSCRIRDKTVTLRAA